MRSFLSSLGLLSLAILALAPLSPTLLGQPAAASPKAAAPASKAAANSDEALRQLPVHQVVLYKNGIGYFEHLGSVTGNQRVAIDFTSSQLNDVLQSLTILDDNGGRIGGVNYNSTTPLAEQLKSLSLAMSDDPTSTELFQALRGQRVEITGAPGGAITGRLMSIESRASSSPTATSEADTTESAPRPTQSRFYLTVVASSGAVRVIELIPSLSVRPLDTALQGQLDRYLQLLSSTHTTGLRHLTLDALGQGPRQLHVSYISEVPVWKSTYRIVFPKDATDHAILQGWAVVDNTIGSDWDNVQLSLVAGAPQSFIQPLSDPLYLRRPEIPISTTAQTTPQTHEAAEMASNNLMINSQQIMNSPLVAPRMVPRDIKMVAEKEAAPTSFGVAGTEMIGSAGGAMGSVYGTGSGGNMGGGVYRTSNAIQEGDVSTTNFDDFFEYRLAQPVTIHKNESAMVPILQESLPAERVTLWSASESTPFRAIWLENSSRLTFDRGSFSIFESGVFAGQGLLDPIHPGEKRLLSYAADQAIRVRVETETLGETAARARQLRSVKITAHGFVQKEYAAQSRTEYRVSNSAEADRVVVLEVPRNPNRKLAPETKPAESAATLYRFRLPVAAHKSAALLVADEGHEIENWKINEADDQVLALQRLSEEAPAIAEKLKPIISAQQSISEMKFLLAGLEQKTIDLTADEARARENLTALKGTEGSKRFADQLNRNEDALEANHQQTTLLNEKRKAAIDALRQTLLTLELSWNSAAPAS